jgi:hypothetical protein
MYLRRKGSRYQRRRRRRRRRKRRRKRKKLDQSGLQIHPGKDKDQGYMYIHCRKY